MNRIEARIVMPSGAEPISNYTRYYGWADQAHRTIQAVYELGGERTSIWLPSERMMAIEDGGCSIVTFTYDVTTDEVEGLVCNGVG